MTRFRHLVLIALIALLLMTWPVAAQDDQDDVIDGSLPAEIVAEDEDVQELHTFDGATPTPRPPAIPRDTATPRPSATARPSAVASGCPGNTAVTSGSTVESGTLTAYTASGFAPGSTLALHITGPSVDWTGSTTVGASCRASWSPSGVRIRDGVAYTFALSGTHRDGHAYERAFTEMLDGGMREPTATAAPTPHGTGHPCSRGRLEASFPTRIYAGQDEDYHGYGFDPGTRVDIDWRPEGAGPLTVSSVRYADDSCQIRGTVYSYRSTRAGRYTLVFSGRTPDGAQRETTVQFDVVAQPVTR